MPGNEARALQCSCSMLIGVMMTSFTEVKLFSTITYGIRNPLHARCTFTNTEGLVNYLLQDNGIATEKATGFHTTPQTSLVRKRKK